MLGLYLIANLKIVQLFVPTDLACLVFLVWLWHGKINMDPFLPPVQA